MMGRKRFESGAVCPPWSSATSVHEKCTSCGACIAACPEGILRPGRAGTPIVDFALGACTFCRACAESCAEAVFDVTRTPFDFVVGISAKCLLRSGVYCRSCTDICDASALRFDLRIGPVGRISVDADACTACGACVGTCPAGAIQVAKGHSKPEALS